MKTISNGKCRICGMEFSRAGITRHTLSCVSNVDMSEGIPEKGKLFDIFITDRWMKEFWLMVEISEKENLSTLDNFLRKIWCECCGHLSEFEINGKSYYSMSASDLSQCFFNDGKTMDYPLKKVLEEGSKFGYTYDFGSSTELVLEVKKVREGSVPKKREVRLLSRNKMPALVCSACKKRNAAYINSFAHYEDDVLYLCSSCAKKVEEGDFEEDDLLAEVEDGALLPVCNSPRMGVCGYEGEFDRWND